METFLFWENWDGPWTRRLLLVTAIVAALFLYACIHMLLLVLPSELSEHSTECYRHGIRRNEDRNRVVRR